MDIVGLLMSKSRTGHTPVPLPTLYLFRLYLTPPELSNLHYKFGGGIVEKVFVSLSCHLKAVSHPSQPVSPKRHHPISSQSGLSPRPYKLHLWPQLTHCCTWLNGAED
ncbi:hypothetical protein QQF64_020198 [Cirrhinus molitorella]|uniref:Uncharacterized protein n=1 Tax=Cirrhinus molitorella TaxID=172907 RepID=A0ABR3L8Q1_9TELE